MITVEQLAARLGWTVEYAEHVVDCYDCGFAEDDWSVCRTWQLLTGGIMHGPLTREDTEKWEERKGWPLNRLIHAMLAEGVAAEVDRQVYEEYDKPIKVRKQAGLMQVSRELLE